MSTPDITKAIPSNDIKNGASLLLVNKTGIEVLFDSSRDTEQGLEVLAPETTDRFNDRTYYFPSSTSSPGTSSTDTLDNVTDRGAITTNGLSAPRSLVKETSTPTPVTAPEVDLRNASYCSGIKNRVKGSPKEANKDRMAA